MAVSSYTNMSSATYAIEYTRGWLYLTCILKEGNITKYTTGEFHEGGEVSRTRNGYAAAISKGDYVKLSPDTANTLDATEGAPVVDGAITGNTDLIFGIVVTPPKVDKVAATNQTVWATMLAGHYYRTATVAIPSFLSPFEAVTVDAASGTTVLPGSSMVYDLSSQGWVYGRVGLTGANSGAWDGSGADTGANAFIAEPIALHYSISDTGVIGILPGLIPLMTQA